jgi:hypothetical protein
MTEGVPVAAGAEKSSFQLDRAAVSKYANLLCPHLLLRRRPRFAAFCCFSFLFIDFKLLAFGSFSVPLNGQARLLFGSRHLSTWAQRLNASIKEATDASQTVLRAETVAADTAKKVSFCRSLQTKTSLDCLC